MNSQRNHTRMVFGVLVVLVGILALADNLLQINTRRVLQFWPVVFMVIGAMKLSHTRHSSGYIVGAGFVALGLLMTLENLDVISFRLRDWWPLLVIFAGVAMIAKNPLRRSMDDLHQRLNTPEETATDLNATAVMSSSKLSVMSKDFRHGEATAVMGGMEIDFRQASMQSAAMLKVVAVFGGIEMKVPPDWSVECRVMTFLAGVEDKTVPSAQAGKRLVIEGFVMMGGVVVKN
jgi:hypothetical protein